MTNTIAFLTPRGMTLCHSCFTARGYTQGRELTEADSAAHVDCDSCSRPIVDEDAETPEQAESAIRAYARAHGFQVAS